MHASVRSTPTRAGTAVVLLAAVAMALGACTGVSASNVPTLPAVNVPTMPPSGAGSACLDTATMTILDQLKATGANTSVILAANKDALIAGLNQFQPTDSAVVTWRDTLVAAIRSDDAQKVATQIAMVANGQVTIPPC
jgi:hypothetical protein